MQCCRMAKPFLKWVGGKRQLVPALLDHLPASPAGLAATGARYFEPFLGGGALFFALQERGWAHATLNDMNPELINVYRVVQTDAPALIERLADPVFGTGREAFDAVRAWDRAEGWEQRCPVDRAARFIYLNRMGFNGVWRVNKRGFFNVPYGQYASLRLPPAQVLLDAQRALAGVTLLNGDFQAACSTAQRGDVVYFDPPYAPVSATANFVGYTLNKFDDGMQRRLAGVCADLGARGVTWVVSNSDTPYAHEVFGGVAGATTHLAQAARRVNRNNQRRGRVNEIIVVGAAAGLNAVDAAV